MHGSRFSSLVFSSNNRGGGNGLKIIWFDEEIWKKLRGPGIKWKTYMVLRTVLFHHQIHFKRFHQCCRVWFQYFLLIFIFPFRNAVSVLAHMRMEQNSMHSLATIISMQRALWNGLRWMQHVLSASTTFSREMNRYEEKIRRNHNQLGRYSHILFIFLYRRNQGTRKEVSSNSCEEYKL